jgi:hypothetical protein
MLRLKQILMGSLTALAVLASDAGLTTESRAAESSRTPELTAFQPRTVYAADAIISGRHPLEAAAIAAPGAAIDKNGLIGRNRRYGKMVSPRLQLGAGAALRIGLHVDRRMAIKGFRAIEAATRAIATDGEVVSTVPQDAPTGTTLSASDQASGAAFFMADACPALLALRESPQAAAIATATRQEQATGALGRGLSWLLKNARALESVDRAAPNRLLYDALAYQSCGALVGNAEAQTMSARFIALALSQARPDGVFVEKGGSDTTYQAVSVRLAVDLLLTGYSNSDARQLNIAWQSGALWLGSRIMADGRIDSAGNTRTCAGGESFLGAEKKVWPPGIYGALIYAAELTANSELNAAAARLSAWARANPHADPCSS